MAYTQIQKILSRIATADDDFGKFVVVDGYHMVVSSYNSEAVLYKRNIEGEWGFRTELSGEGVAIAMSNSFIALSDSNGSDVYVFDKDTSDGSILQTINEAGGVEFGNSIAIHEDYIVIADQAANTNTGEIFIYEKTGTNSWTAYANNPVTADVTNTQDFFGSAVAVTDDSIIVGAMGDDNKKGAVYIFQKDVDTGVWEQTQKIFISDGSANDQFGESISASEDHFVAGASLKDSLSGDVNSGAAYVFKYSTSWYEVDKLVSVDETTPEEDRFGESVYINGDYIIVGSPAARSNKGVADVFYKKRSWGHLKKILGSDTAPDDNFGTSVSVSGRFIAVGSPNEDTAASNAGAVYIYEDPSVRLRLAQEFEVNGEFIPTKASTYLKRVGENTSDFWAIYNTQKTVIDATNFSTIDKKGNIVTFDDTILGFTGNGYMVMNEDNPSFSDIKKSVINYPIRAITPDTYDLWLRVINTISNTLEIEVLIDGNVSKTISTLIDNPSDGLEWSWINTTLVLPDNRDHTLGIRIKENNVAIDKIYIEVDSSTPYTEGPDLSAAPYLTAHMRVYDSLNGEPNSPIFVYDYKNSITEVIQDDWYNFDIKVLDDTHGYVTANDFSENYYLVMSVSGSNTSNFIVWELVDNDEYNAPSSAIKF
jgi:hypothetical protein